MLVLLLKLLEVLTLVTFGLCGLLHTDEAILTDPSFIDTLAKIGRYDILHKITRYGVYNPSWLESEKYDFSYLKELHQKDMFVYEAPKEKGRQGVSNKSLRWRNGLIPYRFSDNYPLTQRRIILDAINNWNQQLGSCIRIVPSTIERDYVYIVNGDGCSSWIGRIGGRQDLSMQIDSDECQVDIGTLLHEFAHAAGVIHEQSRPDRDNYITINEENLDPDFKIDWDKTKQRVDLLGTYDCNSLMHYDPFIDSVNGEPVFTPKTGVDCSNAGKADNFTPSDLNVLKKMYCTTLPV